ncbi:Holliday junction resolvase [Haloarcula californiae tailed virus 2]|uniref:Holliday junction resolvase n=1 Tax=Haloarcula californiae tailed virus 2 TaxID=1273747 RepID=R4THP5_9CAUD|nr:Holliday junction resolvase [Haloarcula californiae tailed virus 2]AGM11831.1 holliday junction resolvase [Haloarcula californiae tailed virus 2]
MVDGDAKERELVREIEGTNGWVAMRAPSSGSATDRDLPDVLAGHRGRTLVVELKSSGGDPIYIDQEEVQALQRFARAFGGQALLACRWSSRSLQDSTFYFSEPERLYRTDAGTYRAKYEDMAQWTPLPQVLRG